MTAAWWSAPDLDDEDDRPSYIELQGAQRDPGQWFACEAPERPFDRMTCMHDCCPTCLVAARAGVMRGDLPHFLPDEMQRRLDLHGPAPRLEAK